MIPIPCLTGILHAPVVLIVIWSEDMGDRKYLTAEEVAARYRGAVSVGTLRNWRARRVGPAFVKIGKAILYPVDELDAWEKRNMVSCRASGRATVTVSDQA
jgi:Helix-turn-helix domain